MVVVKALLIGMVISWDKKIIQTERAGFVFSLKL